MSSKKTRFPDSVFLYENYSTHVYFMVPILIYGDLFTGNATAHVIAVVKTL